jgi:hypothetical protein
MFSLRRYGAITAALPVVWLALPALAIAQPRDVSRIEGGTQIVVRTSENIDERAANGRIYAGTVDQDVLDPSGQVAIPRGSAVELEVRSSSDGDELILDLDSVVVNGERYGVRAEANRVDAPEGRSDGHSTATYVGGGAVLGTIIGAIAGGGKGAAIGAAAGAAAGAGAKVLTHGHEIVVPAESVLTFRLQRALDVGVPDQGFERDQHHYHHNQEGR